MNEKQQKILIIDTDQFIIRTLTSKLEGDNLQIDSADQS
jgi:CheY-like chemotaxis protein